MSSMVRDNSINGSVLAAEVDAYSRQMPVLYFVAMANTGTVALSHHGIVPTYLTAIIAPIIIAVGALRMIFWLRSKNLATTVDQAVATARRATFVSAAIGLVMLIWLIALWLHGNVETRGHVVLSIGITGVAAVLGMMHLRRAAIVMATMVTVPFALFLLTRGGVSTMIAVNLLLVVVAALFVLFVASDNFKEMVRARIEATRLGDENLKLANHDNLTGLPNRRHFFKKLDNRIRSATSNERRLAVGVIDLDGFKPVNDLHGHALGDQVLRLVAERLKESTGAETFVARLGGDEFALIVDEDVSDEGLAQIGAHICSELAKPFAASGIVVNMGASVGFAIFPDIAATASDLYERADYALYHVKQNGRGKCTLYTQDHEIQVRAESSIGQCMRHADLESEMYLQFQPVMDIGADRVIAFEALARWKSPMLGDVSPGVFIPVAERSQLINEITRVLLRKALHAATSWPQDVGLSFNLSTRDLISPQTMLSILAIVKDSGVTPARIGFEVTETALMGDVAQADESIRLLKALGVQVSLDDFGTGYSSLSHVHQFAFDKIKIDRSFVTTIETHSASRSIVRSVVDLCRSLNIGCVVEGMETEGQADVLLRLGCNEMQGYLFSKPINEAEIPAYLARNGETAAFSRALSA
jgi:diguanylate cyclase (GGDEF)-like protein